jgi:hypothetical protein
MTLPGKADKLALFRYKRFLQVSGKLKYNNQPRSVAKKKKKKSYYLLPISVY